MRKHFASILMAALAMTAALAFYIVNLKVSAERTRVEMLRGAIARDEADIRILRTELRTRASLPQLQQWNDVSLQLGAPGPRQLLANPVQLAAFAPGASGQPAPAPQPGLIAPPTEPAPAQAAPVLAANVADTPMRAVAAAASALQDARLAALAAQGRAEQQAATRAALEPQ